MFETHWSILDRRQQVADESMKLHFGSDAASSLCESNPFSHIVVITKNGFDNSKVLEVIGNHGAPNYCYSHVPRRDGE